jgi:tyrosine-protein kinase Etk/Wzc
MTPDFPTKKPQTSGAPDTPVYIQEPEFDIREYLSILIRRRRTLLAAFLVIFIGVAVYTFTMKPVYEASATLHVRDEKTKTDPLGAFGMSIQNPVETEVEIIKSRTNAEQVVRRLHLDWKITNKSNGLTFQIGDFDCVPGTGYSIAVSGPDTYKVYDQAGKFIAEGRSGELLQKPPLRLLISDIKGKPDNSFYLTLIPLQSAVDPLRKRIKAAEVRKMTSIINITFRDTDPNLARDVVNTLSHVYLESSLALKTQEANKILEFIDQNLGTVRGDLDTAEKNLQTYKSGPGVVHLDKEAEELVKKLSETEKERAGIALQRKQAEYALGALREAARTGQVYTPSTSGLTDPGVASVGAKLAELEVQKRALLADSTEAHPRVKAIQEQIGEIQKKLASIYETSLKNLAKQESAITQTLGGYEAMLRKLPTAERDLAQLTRHTKVNAELYTLLLQKREESRIAKTSTIGNINIIDPAITPVVPVKPKTARNLLFGLLVGLIAGVGLAFLQENIDDTIKDAEGAKRELDAPILAVIPHIPRVESESKDGHGISLITTQEPKSSISESFRALRTSIHFSAINREKKTILVTSTFPGEGKTTIIANLAIIMAQTGARVLLIDCDLRRPKQHELFNHSKAPGLTEVLAGDTPLEAVLHNTGIPNFDFASAGTTPPNPSELLGSDNMANFLASLRQRYDHILIDAPPVLAVTDAPLLTSRCDLAVVVMETERVPVKAAQRMAELLGSARAPVAGIVINDKSSRTRERYGYYGGKHYGYGSYGYGYGYGYGVGYYSDERKRPRKKAKWWRRFLA